MSYLVLRILETAECQRLTQALDAVTFIDGKATAGKFAADVKRNLQMERTSPQPQELDQQLLAALHRNDEFKASVFPKRIVLPLFARYEPGMEYGAHVDAALMASGAESTRTDLAMTIFLSPASSYDGGELVIEESLGQQEIKLDAGEAIVYPATTVHRVAPVTRGVRLVAVTWIQSLVRDPRLREILHDLWRVMGDSSLSREQRMLVHKSHQNLLRIVVEP